MVCRLQALRAGRAISEESMKQAEPTRNDGDAGEPEAGAADESGSQSRRHGAGLHMASLEELNAMFRDEALREQKARGDSEAAAAAELALSKDPADRASVPAFGRRGSASFGTGSLFPITIDGDVAAAVSAVAGQAASVELFGQNGDGLGSTVESAGDEINTMKRTLDPEEVEVLAAYGRNELPAEIAELGAVPETPSLHELSRGRSVIRFLECVHEILRGCQMMDSIRKRELRKGADNSSYIGSAVMRSLTAETADSTDTTWSTKGGTLIRHRQSFLAAKSAESYVAEHIDNIPGARRIPTTADSMGRPQEEPGAFSMSKRAPTSEEEALHDEAAQQRIKFLLEHGFFKAQDGNFDEIVADLNKKLESNLRAKDFARSSCLAKRTWSLTHSLVADHEASKGVVVVPSNESLSPSSGRRSGSPTKSPSRDRNTSISPEKLARSKSCHLSRERLAHHLRDMQTEAEMEQNRRLNKASLVERISWYKHLCAVFKIADPRTAMEYQINDVLNRIQLFTSEDELMAINQNRFYDFIATCKTWAPKQVSVNKDGTRRPRPEWCPPGEKSGRILEGSSTSLCKPEMQEAMQFMREQVLKIPYNDFLQWMQINRRPVFLNEVKARAVGCADFYGVSERVYVSLVRCCHFVSFHPCRVYFDAD